MESRDAGRRPRCVIVLSTKSAGSSALQHFLCRFARARFVEYSRHTGRTTVETLYWTKAASILGLPQVRLPDSEVPISPRKALGDLHSLLRDNVPHFVIPAEPRQLVMEGWRTLCRHYAPTFVEKSPHHLHQWSVLELLDQAVHELSDIDFRFIGLVRNPMDVLYSAWTRWRTRPDVLQHHWQMAYDNLRRWQSSAGDRLLCLRYEDFSGSPGTATRLLQFLDVPPAPEAEGFIHGKSRQRWRTDPWFRFRLDPQVEAAAQAWGYTQDEIYNEPAASWMPYSLVTRTAHRLWSIPEQKARQTYRRFRRAVGDANTSGPQ